MAWAASFLAASWRLFVKELGFLHAGVEVHVDGRRVDALGQRRQVLDQLAGLVAVELLFLGKETLSRASRARNTALLWAIEIAVHIAGPVPGKLAQMLGRILELRPGRPGALPLAWPCCP